MADIATECRLFVFGTNETEKGTFVLSKADAAAVLAAYQARGTKLSWDYEHAIIKDSTGPCPAAAWCGLEVRKDGLWATGIKWTATARSMIEKEEYLYFSPFFEHTKDGHVTNIVNIALTNTPATHGISPLVAVSALASRRGVRGAAQLIPRASRPLNNKPGATALAAGKNMDKDAILALLAQLVAAIKGDGGGDGGDGGGDADALAAGDGDGDSKTDDEKKEDAQQAASALCALTGEKSPMKALAKLVDGQTSNEVQTSALSHAQRVAEGKANGKIPPALETWAMSLSASQLTDYLGRVKGVPTKTNGAALSTGAKGAKAPATSLSAAQSAVAQRMGIKPEKYLDFLNKRAASGGQKGGV